MLNNSCMILLNGPALCGKGSFVEHLHKVTDPYKRFPEEECFPAAPFTELRCKDKLHRLTQEFFCASDDTYWEIYNDRTKKELPQEVFKIRLASALKLRRILPKFLDDVLATKGKLPEIVYLTIREAMIYVSEVVCKPTFGEEYFGLARANEMQDDTNYIDDSCGFIDELAPLKATLPEDNILLIRIHRLGCSFNGDSRNYIPDGVIKHTVDVSNDTTEEGYNAKMLSAILEWDYNKGIIS